MQCGELAAFCVHPSYRGSGRGDSLLDYVEQDARLKGMRRLVLLTTRTADWFEQRDFVMDDYAHQRFASRPSYHWRYIAMERLTKAHNLLQPKLLWYHLMSETNKQMSSQSTDTCLYVKHVYIGLRNYIGCHNACERPRCSNF